LRKAIISFVMSARLFVRPSSRMEQLGSHDTSFDEVFIFELLFPRKSADEVQVSLKSVKNNGYFICRRFLIYDNISLNSEMFQIKVVEKIKTHILYSLTFFWKTCAIWDHVEIHGTAREAADDNIAMRVACWISKATRNKALPTHSRTHAYALNNAPTYKPARIHKHKYVLLCFPTASLISRTRLDVRLYVHCPYFVCNGH
jgi:hypothetical protein